MLVMDLRRGSKKCRHRNLMYVEIKTFYITKTPKNAIYLDKRRQLCKGIQKLKRLKHLKSKLLLSYCKI